MREPTYKEMCLDLVGRTADDFLEAAHTLEIMEWLESVQSYPSRSMELIRHTYDSRSLAYFAAVMIYLKV